MACPLTGRKRRRCMPLEMAWVQVAKEAGGRAKHNFPIGRIGVPDIAEDDQRRVDGVVWGMNIFRGVPIVMDATIRAPLTGAGLPAHGADRNTGGVFAQARKDKESVYSEIHQTDQAKFLTLACETGGRWSPECIALVRALVAHKSEQAPPALRASAKQVWARRFWGLLSVAAMKGITQSLEGFTEVDDSGAFSVQPSPEELLAGVDVPPAESRVA